MRRFVIATALAAVPAVSLAATFHADSYSRQRFNDYYYKSYDTAYEPICVVRKIRWLDDKSDPVVRKVRVCANTKDR
jgi:hypothetical protein